MGYNPVSVKQINIQLTLVKVCILFFIICPVASLDKALDFRLGMVTLITNKSNLSRQMYNVKGTN